MIINKTKYWFILTLNIVSLYLNFEIYISFFVEPDNPGEKKQTLIPTEFPGKRNKISFKH